MIYFVEDKSTKVNKKLKTKFFVIKFVKLLKILNNIKI